MPRIVARIIAIHEQLYDVEFNKIDEIDLDWSRTKRLYGILAQKRPYRYQVNDYVVIDTDIEPRAVILYLVQRENEIDMRKKKITINDEFYHKKI